jgi:hypothetical protein
MPAIRVLALLSILAVFTATAAPKSSPVVERVVILDSGFAVVTKLDSSAKVLEFNDHWQAKTTQPFLSSALNERTFTYKLDIKASEGSGRWLYRPDGLLYRLAHNEKPVYKVRRPRDFNVLLGITQ